MFEGPSLGLVLDVVLHGGVLVRVRVVGSTWAWWVGIVICGIISIPFSAGYTGPYHGALFWSFYLFFVGDLYLLSVLTFINNRSPSPVVLEEFV